jgi:SAM-dependent methyltransferase
MEHFLDIAEATSELARVLRPGGRYVCLTHVHQTFRERLSQKFWDYVFPRPRPLQLARWLKGRLKPVAPASLRPQPIQNRYTSRAVKAHLERAGLRLIRVLHTRGRSRPPLNPWAVIYIAERLPL